MDKQNFNDLISKAKAKNQKKTIQKVTPVTTRATEEVQFSFYLEKTLLKQLKLRALDDNESIKSTINEALKLYLKID
ncbi:hypothetical protein JM658_11900 [Joostella atrarenae]|uniref:CopG family transcriptional regulator n=1 Tax=Joostella atrarenae TaxID=679257 RepID=A0ABS9J547_9FLAO|nr:hypothetical protein [Joostella atrarenae]MCF8715529.1 hypothetical protein [Joostella atrarenae]